MPAPETDRITLVCTSHKRVQSGGTATVHGDDWAYCPGGKADSEPGHRWAAIEPATLEEVSHGFVTMALSLVTLADQAEAPEPEASEAS